MTRTHRQQAADFAQWLKEKNACLEARRWARGKTLQGAWETCSDRYLPLSQSGRPCRDWLVWLLYRLREDGAVTLQEFYKLRSFTNTGYRFRGLLDDIEIIDAEVEG
ncbi:hypothetical protein LCGC14_2690260 [marine sediment metagenome]|uniref:Uncharacterized protein n=1 Tax=marine sediment metagenome TaxID=412755 RepID=A0A0F9A682_9ZZZZ